MIYLVIGEHGEYSDHTTFEICYFLAEDAANAHVARLVQLDKQYQNTIIECKRRWLDKWPAAEAAAKADLGPCPEPGPNRWEARYDTAEFNRRKALNWPYEDWHAAVREHPVMAQHRLEESAEFNALYEAHSTLVGHKQGGYWSTGIDYRVVAVPRGPLNEEAK
jgi:hypothetical protein